MKVLPTTGFMTGKMCLERRQATVLKMSTGCAALNDILGGGIETQSITEIHGEYRCGKTQLCHTLCVTCQLPTELGGAQGKVAVIDTEGTFRPEKVAAVADRYGLDATSVLENISVARAYTWEQQNALIDGAAAQMVEEPFKLLVIDSIMGLLRTDFSGRGELSERQQILGQMLSKLKKMASEFNIAVVLTNQVRGTPRRALPSPLCPRPLHLCPSRQAGACSHGACPRCDSRRSCLTRAVGSSSSRTPRSPSGAMSSPTTSLTASPCARARLSSASPRLSPRLPCPRPRPRSPCLRAVSPTTRTEPAAEPAPPSPWCMSCRQCLSEVVYLVLVDDPKLRATVCARDGEEHLRAFCGLHSMARRSLPHPPSSVCCTVPRLFSPLSARRRVSPPALRSGLDGVDGPGADDDVPHEHCPELVREHLVRLALGGHDREAPGAR